MSEDIPEHLLEVVRRVGGEKMVKGLAWLDDPLVRQLANALDVDLSEVDAMTRDVLENLVALESAMRHVGRLGWAVTPSQLPGSVYVRTAALIADGATPGEIDAHMTAAWNEEPWLRRSFAPMFTLTDGSDQATDVMLARQELLNQAVGHHESGEYAASILIVLTQIDGLTSDVRGRGRGAFAGAGAADFVDTVTVAGLPENLQGAWRAIMRERWSTASSGELLRHPILHGRELGYATRINSTKAFALLRAIIEWLQPQASTA
jgi:hypothetical protein